MVVNIKVDTNALKSITKKLGKLEDLNYRAPLKDSLQAVEYTAKRNFDTQGFELGYWAPLKPSTRKQRVSLGYGAARPILIRTGKLKNSFVGEVKSKNSASFTNTQPFAKYHQNGTKNMAKRPIMGINPRLEKVVKQIFENYIHNLIKKL